MSGEPSCSGLGHRSSRFSANQAREMIVGWMNDDSESSGGEENDMDVDLGLGLGQGELFGRDSDDSSSSDDEPAPPTKKRRVAVKGKGKARATPSNASARASSSTQQADQGLRQGIDQTSAVEEWARALNDETQNSFRFAPQFTGVSPDVNANYTPLDCLELLFDVEVKDKLIFDINEYAKHKIQRNTPLRQHSKYHKWSEVDMLELNKFLAVTIMMGIDQRGDLADYFSYSPEFYTPFYHQITTGEKFRMIYSTMLHAGEVHAKGKEKIEPFINRLLGKFQAAFYPFQNLSLDEMVIGFKGRWAYKQFNMSKPDRYHIKTFGLCDSATGYVCNILTYFGSETSYNPELDVNSGHAVKVFGTLLAPFVKGHAIYADRYYTTKELVTYLLQKQYYYTGTLNANRRGFPQEVKTAKLAHREIQFYVDREKKIICTLFRDKKAKKHVTVVSTQCNTDTVVIKDVEKPTVIDSYNQNMNGCDKLDQMVDYYGMHNRRAKKWWRKLFFWMFEIAQYNAYVLYVLSRPEGTTKISLKSFKRKLVHQMLENAAVDLQRHPERQQFQKRGGRPTPAHAIERLQGMHLPLYDDRDRACKVCSTPAKRARTHFYCSGCAVKTYLHPKECFFRYHTQLHL